MPSLMCASGKLYADKRISLPSAMLKRFDNGVLTKGYADIGSRIVVMKDDSLICIKPDGEHPGSTVKAYAAYGDSDIITAFSAYLKFFSDIDVFIGLTASFLAARKELADSFKVLVILSNGAYIELDKEVTSQIGPHAHGGTTANHGHGEKIGFLGGKQAFVREFTKNEVKDPSLLFLASCYLDEDSSTDYDVYDLADGSLSTVRPGPDDIRRALTSVGLQKSYVGVKRKHTLE